MSPRSSVVPILASGTATAGKLLVATLAVTAAYMGASPGVPGIRLVTAAGTARTAVTALTAETGSATRTGPATVHATGAFADSPPPPGTLAAAPGGDRCDPVHPPRAGSPPGTDTPRSHRSVPGRILSGRSVAHRSVARSHRGVSRSHPGGKPAVSC
ncbi:hypothetical protein [Microbispora sp. NPDC049125]|uniref:hypothetical protein n=1 Tax=Microbispora sp. NPDC049125 TaxID=3154929 RepID=UPI003465C4C6